MKEMIENIIIKIISIPIIIIAAPFVIYRNWKREKEYEEHYLKNLEEEIREDLKDKHHLK